MTYSDASDVAWNGYVVQLGGQTAVGSWPEEESVRSSTFGSSQQLAAVCEKHIFHLTQCGYRHEHHKHYFI